MDLDSAHSFSALRKTPDIKVNVYRARIQNKSVTLVRSDYRSYYESNFMGVYSVVTK